MSMAGNGRGDKARSQERREATSFSTTRSLSLGLCQTRRKFVLNQRLKYQFSIPPVVFVPVPRVSFVNEFCRRILVWIREGLSGTDDRLCAHEITKLL